MYASYRPVAILTGIALLIGVCILIVGDNTFEFETTVTDPTVVAEGTAVLEDGVQYIDIIAQAGYSPRTTKAVAGKHSAIRVHTVNTYDCSSALVIPSIGFRETLSPTGIVEIPVPIDKAHGTLEGRCSMGMYRFSIVFT